MRKRDYSVIIVIIIVLFLGAITFLRPDGSLQEPGLPTSSGDCNWEKLNQDVITWFQREERSGGFMAPRGVSYSEVEFTGFGVLAYIPTSDANFYLNGVKCGVLRAQQNEETNVLHDLTDGCLGELREGINTFFTFTTLIDPGVDKHGLPTSGSSTFDTRSIMEIELEMLIKPANCLS